jgi:hypothetical protein
MKLMGNLPPQRGASAVTLIVRLNPEEQLMTAARNETQLDPSHKLLKLTFSPDLLRRGFWLYVWNISLRTGPNVCYVGRTGDSSSPKAQSPFSRVSGHLGPNKHANALRRHLAKHQIEFDDCDQLELVAVGPLFPEADNEDEHRIRRDKAAALERDLCAAMRMAGYGVLNNVSCRIASDAALWAAVRAAFADRFPKLRSE